MAPNFLQQGLHNNVEYMAIKLQTMLFTSIAFTMTYQITLYS